MSVSCVLSSKRQVRGKSQDNQDKEVQKQYKEQKNTGGGGDIFRTCRGTLWGPSSPLYKGHRVSFQVEKQQGSGVNHPPHPAPRLKKELTYSSTLPLGLNGLL